MKPEQAPEPKTLEEQISYDLQGKMADDIEALLRRALDIAPEPWTPLLVQANVTALAGLVMVMSEEEKLFREVHPDNRRMIAALMVGRASICGELHEAFAEAKKDMCVLIEAKRAKL